MIRVLTGQEVESPIELLAHYELHPMLPDECWVPGVQDFVRRKLEGSPFRRVWIYDAQGNAVKFVHPEAA